MEAGKSTRFDQNPDQAWQPYQPTAPRDWTRQHAAHLYRRAAFGGTLPEIDAAHRNGIEPTLDSLFDFSREPDFSKEMATAGRLVSGGNDSSGLASWWLHRMTHTPSPLLEKMTLFWHGHFATGAGKVNDARAMLRQNELLREHALSNFGPLVHQISRDVAMLVYLDSEDNRKTRPNENYARELMELFCLGTGNYSEQDIKEVARAFTGWEIRRGKFRFNPYQHDSGSKSFLGETGVFDGDDAIDIVLNQDAAARFIARKLIRFFVFEDRPVPDSLAEPIARTLREHDLHIGTAVRQILGSQIFFSDQAIGQKIKSPVELSIGFLRFFGATVNMQFLRQRLERLGQLPLYPPNVKGWDGGKTWINASTVLARANLIKDILENGKTKFADGSLPGWVEKHRAYGVGENLDWVNQFLLAVPLQDRTQDDFESRFGKSMPSDPRPLLTTLAAIPEIQIN